MNKQITQVILETPYQAKSPEKLKANIEYARLCMLDCLNRGEAPMVSHLLYTQVLDDSVPRERELGIKAGLSWGPLTNYTVVYIDKGISKGMLEGIKEAKRNNKTIILRSIEGKNVLEIDDNVLDLLLHYNGG